MPRPPHRNPLHPPRLPAACQALTALVARALLGEPLGGRGAGGAALSLVGLVVLMHPPFLAGGHADWGPQRLLGVLFGAAAALLR